VSRKRRFISRLKENMSTVVINNRSKSHNLNHYRLKFKLQNKKKAMTIYDGIQKSGLYGRKAFKHEFVSVLKKNNN